MELQPRTGVSARIFVRSGPSRDLGTSPEVAILAHAVETQSVSLQIEVTEACFARIAYSFNPYLAVMIDGLRVEAFETTGGYIAVELSAGVHDIRLQPRLSPWRRALFGVDGLLLLAAVTLAIRERVSRGARGSG